MPEADTSPVPQRNPRRAPQKRDASLPVLEKLAELYPHLFGAVFLPLKRGIFQDLLAAHPEVFETESLKAALSTHTRSTRYLNSVASGMQRHDLQGQAVEAMAPEHIHHALVEVFRRRQNRTQEDLQPRLLDRMLQAWEESGLSPQDYAERVRTRDATASELLDACMALASERSAKGEALLRAFTASGKTVEEFADMYGMDPEHTAQMLERARTQAA
jgi:sRNA-binding protein